VPQRPPSSKGGAHHRAAIPWSMCCEKLQRPEGLRPQPEQVAVPSAGALRGFRAIARDDDHTLEDRGDEGGKSFFFETDIFRPAFGAGPSKSTACGTKVNRARGALHSTGRTSAPAPCRRRDLTHDGPSVACTHRSGWGSRPSSFVNSIASCASGARPSCPRRSRRRSISWIFGSLIGKRVGPGPGRIMTTCSFIAPGLIMMTVITNFLTANVRIVVLRRQVSASTSKSSWFRRCRIGLILTGVCPPAACFCAGLLVGFRRHGGRNYSSPGLGRGPCVSQILSRGSPHQHGVSPSGDSIKRVIRQEFRSDIHGSRTFVLGGRSTYLGGLCSIRFNYAPQLGQVCPAHANPHPVHGERLPLRLFRYDGCRSVGGPTRS